MSRKIPTGFKAVDSIRSAIRTSENKRQKNPRRAGFFVSLRGQGVARQGSSTTRKPTSFLRISGLSQQRRLTVISRGGWRKEALR